MSKKSYMNKSKLLSEGFFDRISRFLRLRPKVKGNKEKKEVSTKLRNGVNVLNKSIDNYERLIRKQLGQNYPKLPRFEPEDFIQG